MDYSEFLCSTMQCNQYGRQIRLTWLPNTPILHAEDTCSGPNQTAANLAGTDKINICDKATTPCPKKVTQNLSGDAEATFIHDPAQVPITPKSTATRRPCERKHIGLKDQTFAR